MIGNVVSIVVAPPAQIGDSLPKYLTNNGAPSKANISRIIDILGSNSVRSQLQVW